VRIRRGLFSGRDLFFRAQFFAQVLDIVSEFHATIAGFPVARSGNTVKAGI
jgi:hypothetical protein